MRKLITSCCFLLYVNSQSQTPHLTGTITTSIQKGTLSCDLQLSHIPAITDYTIWLNTGLNIQYFRDSSNRNNYYYKRDYDGNNSTESMQYFFANGSKDGKFLPKYLRIKYTGAFPVMTDTVTMYDYNDWKGNIAFNGQSIRAAEQTSWYPILYDKKNDVVLDAYTFDVTVTCEDCETMYMNGDSPKKGTVNRFTSKLPVKMMLFAGNYPFVQKAGINYLNTALSAEEYALLGKWSNGITGFYAKKLGIPFGDNVTYMESAPSSKKNGWMFVTYPTVAIMGRYGGLHNLFKKGNSPVAIDSSYFSYIAHELGHYYFGTLFSPNSDLKWMFLEGTTEYISLQYTRAVLGENEYRKLIAKYIVEVKDMKGYIPLRDIKQSDEITEDYRYRLVPLLLTALEKQIGIEAVWVWLSSVVKDRAATTNYAYFKNSLLKAGMSETAFAAFEARFIVNDKAVENLIAEAR